MRSNGEPFSASAFRELLGDPETNRNELEEFVGAENLDEILSILGLSKNIEELSGAGGGSAMSAGAVSGGVRSEKEEDDMVTRKMTAENIDLSTVDEVMRLIMERGILR